MTPTLIPADLTVPLTAVDRCDRCGARAATRVVFAGGAELLFCGHHARKYDDAVRAVALEVVSPEIEPE
jgi:hypothetical protein